MYDYWRSLVNEINKTHKQHIHSRSICINKRIVAVRNWLVHWHALLLKKKRPPAKKLFSVPAMQVKTQSISSEKKKICKAPKHYGNQLLKNPHRIQLTKNTF